MLSSGQVVATSRQRDEVVVEPSETQLLEQDTSHKVHWRKAELVVLFSIRKNFQVEGEAS